MCNKKIVFLHTDFRSYWPPRLRALWDYLKQQGIDLHVIEIAGAGSPYSFSGKSKNELPWWACLYPDKGMETITPSSAISKVLESLDEINPDIVFAGAIAYPSGAAAVRWARKNKKPVVIFDNARMKDVPRSGIVNWVKKRIYANVDAMFIPAPSHLVDFESWGIPPRRLFFGLNVVDNDMWMNFSPLAETHATIRREFQLPPKFLLGVGRQVEKKNWYHFLYAYHQYQKTVETPLPLVLVGDGPDREALEDYSKSHGLDVRFVDFQTPQELAKYYTLAAAVVLPSFHGETWGLTVNEAMACGTPVLVSHECGCCETLLIEGKTGFSFSPGSVPEMTDTLVTFSSMDDASVNQMGINSRKHISDWDLNRFCSGVLEAIEAVKDERKGYASLIDRILINLWNGRYRPT